MKFSEKWLREWVNPALTTQQLAEQLTMAGLEVESIAPIKRFSGVVVGQILTINLVEKITLCQINVGTSTLSVVTSATVSPGLKVAVAQVGAHLPTLSIKEEKIHGHLSQGMLCSAQLLGLMPQQEVWQLPEDAPIGEDVWHYLQLDDTVFELSVTPNRGDCLSILGIAREVVALNQQHWSFPSIPSLKPLIQHTLPLEVKAPDDCPFYAGRLISDIRPQLLPVWILERLRRSDISSVHPVVDILNYVMLELGQPMHAFDATHLNQIMVRRAHLNEEIVLLNGQTIALQSDTLVIADAHQAHAIAGIMGAQNSALTPTTTQVFLESALFVPECIRGKARRYGLQTESAFRFERGVDPALPLIALERASALIVKYCQGQAGPIVQHQQKLPTIAPILLRVAKVEQIIGKKIALTTIIDLLERLGCKLESAQEMWVTPPSFRYDLLAEIDLIEEICRMVGYHHLPSRCPSLPLQFIKPSQAVSAERIKRLLVDLGYHEVITYSFVDENLQNLLFPKHKKLSLVNPIASDMGQMRCSLWPGLIKVLQYNQNRQQLRMKIFEVGMRFCLQEKLVQEKVIGGLICGDSAPEQWHPSQMSDFFDIKHHIECLGQCISQPLLFKPYSDWPFHPGQGAAIFVNDEKIGLVGRLHPQLTEQLGLKAPVFLFEIKLNYFKKSLPQVVRPSRFPEIRRDLAIVVDEKLASDQIMDLVRKQAGPILTNHFIFDVYSGKGIELGKKSLAIGLILQHSSRTLVDKEVDELIQLIINSLQREFSAKLRD